MGAIDASPLSSEQQPLDALRLELQNEPAFGESGMPKDDYTLTRFLKARGYNASQAKQMILDCIRWRRTVEDVGIEELYRRIDPFDFPGREEVLESWPMGFHKTDKLGRPVNIHTFGAISPKRLYQQMTPQEHWRTVLVNIESLFVEVFPAASAAAGRPIRQALVIVDLKGFGLSQFWTLKSVARRFFEVSQSYYPETMGQLIIVNAPTCFTAVWAVIKAWLSPRTLDKISILGAANPHHHHAALLDLVPPENLPASLGGTCTCDGGCALSNAGPWMDDTRSERRARWLSGELTAPGVMWPPPATPPPQKSELEVEVEQEGEGETWENVSDDEDEDDDNDDPCHAVASASTSAATTPSPSWGRASVVTLPLPLPHPPAPAAVRLAA